MSAGGTVGTSEQFPRTVGFIGLGVMGRPMAAKLLSGAAAAGAGLHVSSRKRSVAEKHLAGGAVWVVTSKEIGRKCDVVVVMVPDLPQVVEVLEGQNGLLAGATTPTVVAVCSTVSPDGFRALADRVARSSNDLVRVVDAPVSGGEEGALEGSLSIMVGGADSDVATAWPVLAAMGTPTHMGPTGAGQVAKACNQIVVAATLLALGEAAVLAERSGLDVDLLFDVLQHGLASSRVLDTKRQRFVAKDYRPSGAASFMAKDLRFALAVAKSNGLVAPHLDVLSTTFDELTEQGFGDQDTSVVRAYIEAHLVDRSRAQGVESVASSKAPRN